MRLALLLAVPLSVCAQDAAILSGIVVDPAQAPVPQAQVQLRERSRNVTRTLITDETGLYFFDSLPPGAYTITVEKPGFAKLTRDNIALATRGRQTIRLAMELETLTSSVTVEAPTAGISSDASAGAALDQDYLRLLPVNGRNVDALLLAAPGITNGGPGGGFNVNGLRANTNYYTLDGVHLSSSSSGGAGPMGGASPMMARGGGPGPGGASSSGTDQISLDALQEVRIQTSAFAPEFGRTPGAQISLSSRGGGNDFHGSAFEYFRYRTLNANDWFANRSGRPRGDMRQNQFGGTLGGRIVKDKTFFFASYEALRLLAPDASVVSVPSLDTRQRATARLRPYLNAFPIPNGPLLEDGAAEFSAVYSNPLDRGNASLRIDHSIAARHSAFLRANFTNTDSTSRGGIFQSPASVTASQNRSRQYTAALISTPRAYMTNDLRVNISQNNSRADSRADTFGGAVPLTDSAMFPPGITAETGEFSLMVLGLTSYSHASRSRSEQTQLNFVDSLTLLAGTHQYRIGADFRRIAPTLYRKPYSVNYTFNGLSGEDGSLLSGEATNAVVTSNLETVFPAYTNFSFYFQDTWRASPKTTITYGLRWDVNPAPATREGPHPLALSSSFSNRVTQNEPLYDTRWSDLSPRFGLSTQVHGDPGKEWILRMGLGLFRDIGYGTTASVFGGAPYANVRTLTSPVFPLPAADLAPPKLPPATPYGQISAAERSLRSPSIYQWNATLEKHIGNNQTLSAGYTGTSGKNLLRTTQQPSFYDDYDLLRLATNGAESSYHGLQVQLARRLTQNFQTQLAYTWSHSIDSASNDAGFGFASLFGAGERGSSDYDVRHNLSFSGSYLIPHAKPPVLKQLSQGWSFEWMATARTGTPFQIQGVSADTTDKDDITIGNSNRFRGLFAQVRPNYNGAPVWLDDSNVPGGRRLNPNAFETPGEYEQGNLARNALRGFGMSQLDLSISRQFALTERFRLHFQAQAFNALNSPAFMNPSPNEGASMASPNFGIVSRSLGQGFGGGTGSTYRSGGPRSVQLGLRLRF